MDRWQDKIAVVTGASSGIGEAIARDLHRKGMVVLALARRQDRLEDIRSSLPIEKRSRFYIKCCDVTDEEQVKSVFSFAESELGGVDVLINNAGIAKQTQLVKADNTKDIKAILETNVLGVVYCTREAFHLMKEGGDEGHIVFINSLAGHSIPDFGEVVPSINIYPPSKHALTAMVEIYRREFASLGTKIRVTNISPGFVDTAILPEQTMDTIKAATPMLDPEDVSSAVIYALSTPPHVQIHEITLRALGAKI